MTSPAVALLRDAESDRFVGGSGVLKTAGLLANRALEQIRGELVPGEGSRTLSFTLNATESFPRRLSYTLSAKRQKLESDPANVSKGRRSERRLCNILYVYTVTRWLLIGGSTTQPWAGITSMSPQ